MTDAAQIPEQPASRKGKKTLILSAITGAVVTGGAAFWATYSGMIPIGTGDSGYSGHALAARSYVAIDPITVNLQPGGRNRHLRLAVQLEVPPQFAAELRALQPRILDLLNGYLSALSLADIEGPAAIIRVRSHLLHRITMIAGEGRVLDLLITEFVLN